MFVIKRMCQLKEKHNSIYVKKKKLTGKNKK